MKQRTFVGRNILGMPTSVTRAGAALACMVFAGTEGGCASSKNEKAPTETAPASLELGNFSVSLTVKDLAASRAFYEKLGFHVIAGDAKQNWLILQSQTSTIGIFQGMFPKNTLTFNPGWDRSSNTLTKFQDVREIQRELKNRGIEMTMMADESTSGPASAFLIDPDGNPILIDQHVPSPKK